MRAKRSKQYRKLMHHYHLSFSFREPYQVLLDAAIIRSAAAFKMRLGSLLETTLHGQVKPMITQCCIRHLYDMPVPDNQKEQKEAWIEVAKQAERRRCGHHDLEQPLSTLECISSVVDPKASGTNKHRYVVASQDPEVRSRMREIAGVPLVYINRSVMILEPMAAKTEEVRAREERSKVRAGLKGRRPATTTGVKRKREDGNDEELETGAGGTNGTDEMTSERQVKKRTMSKGPKGPNPLSVKKSTKDKPKALAQREEVERAAISKAGESNLHASRKAMVTSARVDDGATGIIVGMRKRKRKRKPRDHVGDSRDATESRAAAGAATEAGDG